MSSLTTLPFGHSQLKELLQHGVLYSEPRMRHGLPGRFHQLCFNDPLIRLQAADRLRPYLEDMREEELAARIAAAPDGGINQIYHPLPITESGAAHVRHLAGDRSLRIPQVTRPETLADALQIVRARMLIHQDRDLSRLLRDRCFMLRVDEGGASVVRLYVASPDVAQALAVHLRATIPLFAEAPAKAGEMAIHGHRLGYVDYGGAARADCLAPFVPEARSLSVTPEMDHHVINTVNTRILGAVAPHENYRGR